MPAIGVVAFPIRILVEFVQTIPTYAADNWARLTTAGSSAYHSMWAPVLLYELGANLAKIAFAILLALLFFKKRRSVPYVYIGFLGGSLLLQAADLVLAGVIPAAASSVGSKDWGELARAVVGFAIWGWYFMVSRRVKAIFVNGRNERNNKA